MLHSWDDGIDGKAFKHLCHQIIQDGCIIKMLNTLSIGDIALYSLQLGSITLKAGHQSLEN